jgi:hypothetical protein
MFDMQAGRRFTMTYSPQTSTFNLFSGQVHNAYEYFSKASKPSQERLQMWHQKLLRFSDDQICKAFDYIKNNDDDLPRNVPKKIKDTIANLFGKEDTKKWINYGHCAGCGGSGGFTLFIRNKAAKQWYESSIFCSECDNWRNLIGEDWFHKCKTTKAELLSHNIIHVQINQALCSWRRLNNKPAKRPNIFINNPVLKKPEDIAKTLFTTIDKETS